MIIQLSRFCIYPLITALLVLPQDSAAATGVEADTSAPVLSAAYLEEHQVKIGEIYIDNENVFDLNVPEESGYLYRLTNKLHVITRPKIIRRQLLFHPGEPYSQRLLEESERILRSNDYLLDAKIEPLRVANGLVDIRVRTTDVWTMDPKLSFGRSGGENNSSFGVREANLFGTGMYLGLYRTSRVDRDSTTLQFIDRQLGKSWHGLAASVSDNSDGSAASINYERPFYALDSRLANGISVSTQDQVDSLYDRGEIQSDFLHKSDTYRAYAGKSKGLVHGWVSRFTTGLVYDKHRFSANPTSLYGAGPLPDDRKLVYPFIGIELIEDRFEEANNRDQIGRTEDRFLGTHLALELGYASTSLGSSENAVLLHASASKGFGDSDSNSLLTSATLDSRWSGGSAENAMLKLQSQYYRRQSDHRLFYADLSATLGNNLDLDNQLLLGGDSGLRGYPLRYQGGDSSALFTLEQRFYTDWYPFHLFRVGAAVFFDAGQTWGNNPVGGENLGLLTDVGFGLRLGNTHSGTGKVIHIDVAFPLGGESDISSAQLLLKAKASF